VDVEQARRLLPLLVVDEWASLGLVEIYGGIRRGAGCGFHRQDVKEFRPVVHENDPSSSFIVSYTAADIGPVFACPRLQL